MKQLITKYHDILCFLCYVVSKLLAEEKKAVKRSYQKIQEDEDDEDDDYRSHNSPRNQDASAAQLVRTPIVRFNDTECRIYNSSFIAYSYATLSFLIFFITFPSSIPFTNTQTEELVKALQDLENAASGDAAVRQKIASLPQEVQDVSLLEKITGKI